MICILLRRAGRIHGQDVKDMKSGYGLQLPLNKLEFMAGFGQAFGAVETNNKKSYDKKWRL